MNRMLADEFIKRDIKLAKPAPKLLAELEAMAPNLDPYLLKFYRQTAGLKEHVAMPMRPLSISEIYEWQHQVAEENVIYCDGKLMLLFATDDQSNYAGIFTSGPLLGKVFWLDHEEILTTPVFESPVRFYEEVFAAIDDGERRDWPAFQTDYPTTEPTDSDPENLKLALGFVQSYFEDPELNQTDGFHALQLIPWQDTEKILPLAKMNEDMWVQEAACWLLGERQFTEAIDLLAEVAVNGGHNGKMAAIRALKKMDTPEAQAALARLGKQ